MSTGTTLWMNGTVYTPDGPKEQGRIRVSEIGTVLAVGGPELEPLEGEAVIDCGGSLVLPGLIDVHVHGGGGFGVGDGTYESLDEMSRFHASYGTTSFLATTSTMEWERTLDVLAATANTIERGLSGAEAVGIHLEGPYLDAKRRGAQTLELLRKPDLEEMQQILDAAAGRIRLVTLAPELEGALDVVRLLARRGITVSAGHSDATIEQMRRAVEAGVSHTTHHFNGMSPLHHREPGLAGAGLMLKELTTEVICDGIHVHPDVVSLLFNVKGPSGVCLITDSVPPAGLPDGDYERVQIRQGVITLKDGGSLAGSSLTSLAGLRNAIRFTGLPLERVLPSFTEVPARQIGLSSRKGSLEVGKDADLVLTNKELALKLTVVRGKAVFDSASSKR